jgi:hypothetical protein
VGYTAKSVWERPDAISPWTVRSEYGVVRVRSTMGWHGQWDQGPWISIPGARHLKVFEAVRTGFRSHSTYGRNYKIVAAHRLAALPALRDWCRSAGDQSLGGGDSWIEESVWDERQHEDLNMLFIPELDESRDELRAVATAERRCREAQAFLTDAQKFRLDALIYATHRRQYSRRTLAEATGLSFGRIQQLLRSS